MTTRKPTIVAPGGVGLTAQQIDDLRYGAAMQALHDEDQQRGTVAPIDLLIERPDLGDGISTRIAKGDRIPPSLADYRKHEAPSG